MTEYAISTNLISWAPAMVDLFGWPVNGPEAEVVEEMQPGDLLIPKFAKTPDYHRSGGRQTGYVREICEALELVYEDVLAAYERKVANGEGAVPFVWSVAGSPRIDRRFPGDWAVVPIVSHELELPYSTSEFLRMRATPLEIARQFKATTAPGRHIQVVPDGTADNFVDLSSHQRTDVALRNLCLVKGDELKGIFGSLESIGVRPRDGDFVFLANEDYLSGCWEVHAGGIRRIGQEVSLSPAELVDLVGRAIKRELPSDGFKPGNLRRAAQQLSEFVASDVQALRIDEFAQFYDRYVNLAPKVSQALEIAKRQVFEAHHPDEEDEGEELDEEAAEEGEDSEQLEEDRLRGLTVAEVEAKLDSITLPSSVLREAVTAMRAGKHLLLSGPPGTGKSMIAGALCRSVVDEEFQVATATADWTTFATIGGYMPQQDSALEFEPGIVLRALERGRWLVIDELNRADIDKAFGPLFTLLSGSGRDHGGDDVTLPFRKADKNIRIVRARRRSETAQKYVLTPTWRLIGTLNVSDKASLFDLSFAFLRRFAVIDVPLPAEDDYRDLFLSWLTGLGEAERGELADAAIALAFAPRPLGPAILKDVAEFTRMGTTPTETASGESAYDDPLEAFLTATRLYAAPQYEGAEKEEVDSLLQRLRAVWNGEPPGGPWQALERALEEVALR